MAAAFLNSSEFQAGTGPRLTSFLLYALLLLRDPTLTELNLRVTQLQAGTLVRDIVQEILNSPEFTALLN